MRRRRRRRQSPTQQPRRSRPRRRARRPRPSSPPPRRSPPMPTRRACGRPVNPWPLIAVHAVLMPDGRVLTYGTDGNGTADRQLHLRRLGSRRRPDGGHLTLPNGTGTDIFCSSQLVLPQGGIGLHRRRRQLDRHGDAPTPATTTPTCSILRRNSLTRGNNMNRARWYSTSTTLLNGETYIQGGTGGTDRPEIRGTDGSFRLLTGADTSGARLHVPAQLRRARRPRLRLRQRRPHVLRQHRGQRHAHARRASSLRPTAGSDAQRGDVRARAASCSSAATPTARSSSTSPARTPIVTPTASMSSQRRLGHGHAAGRRQGARHRRQQRVERADQRQQQRRDLEPGDRRLDAGRAAAPARACTTRSRCCCPTPRVLVAGGGAPRSRMNNLNAEIYYPPYLFAAGRRRSRRGPIISRRADGGRHRPHLRRRRRPRPTRSAGSRSSRPAR